MARLTSSQHETNGEDQAFTSSPRALEGTIFPEETRPQYPFVLGAESRRSCMGSPLSPESLLKKALDLVPGDKV
jgi:hypothetical protein